jgi:peptidoglycan/LPS O-acetylase OafA/YrhL
MGTAVALAPVKHNAPQTGRFYRPELDVLRFFAFLGVFTFHAVPRNLQFYSSVGLPHAIGTVIISVLGSGAYGVDLFFALSAYLITSLLLREREATGRLDLRAFYLRRILRIWPLYLTFVALAAIVAVLSHTQHLAMKYVIGYTFLAGNWIYVFHGMPASFATPLWTVSIEEQFYLTWPVACRKLSPRRIAALAIALLAVANLSRVVLAAFGASVQVMEFNTISRLDPIALGTLLALFESKMFKLDGPKRWALIAGGLATWVAASAYSGSGMVGHTISQWRLVLTRPAIALASIVILLAALGSSQGFFKNKVVIYCGKISYGLYVIHEFGRFLASYFVHAHGPATIAAQDAIALSFTLVLAMISYRWLETPFLRLKDRYSHVVSRPVSGL